ncbi:nicotinate-nucleotide pyrophosphorylase [Lysinibacillus sp. TE18511]
MNIIKLEEMLKQFFNEDIGDGDLSGEFIFSAEQQGSFTFYAKESGIFVEPSSLSMDFFY